MEEKSSCKVCVTGGAGYKGSSLVKKLLDKGLHCSCYPQEFDAEDESKVGLLKSFIGADKRLKLFEADIYKPEELEKAIQGYEFVFHVATPLLHSEGFQVPQNNHTEGIPTSSETQCNQDVEKFYQHKLQLVGGTFDK